MLFVDVLVELVFLVAVGTCLPGSVTSTLFFAGRQHDPASDSQYWSTLVKTHTELQEAWQCQKSPESL